MTEHEARKALIRKTFREVCAKHGYRLGADAAALETASRIGPNCTTVSVWLAFDGIVEMQRIAAGYDKEEAAP
jgi:hypothetical protein